MPERTEGEVSVSELHSKYPVKQSKTASKDILKRWFGMKNSIGKGIYGFYLNQQNVFWICVKAFRAEPPWSK